jgi:hypothetical protein
MDPEIQRKLREEIPAPMMFKNPRGFDYIKPHTAIDRLIQATGEAGWSFHITDTKVQYNAQGFPVHVAMQGVLAVGHQSRTDWGEAKTTGNPTEELFKTCQSDTIKRCARMFGVALELYGDMVDEETGVVTHKASAPVQTPLNNRNPQEWQQPQQAAPPGNGGRKTYPTENQLPYARKAAAAIGYDWDRDADQIINAVHGKPGPLYRNDEYQEVYTWMNTPAEHERYRIPSDAVPAEPRYSIDDVPWPEG